MYLVGLTGGIGSGKSTVAARLAERGAVIVDADEIAREVVEPGQPALDALVDAFGDTILAPDGRLDRAATAALVFDDPTRRAELERITHPAIAERIAGRLAGLRATLPADGIVVLDHPLLIETGRTDDLDDLVVVLAPESVRVARVVTSRGLDERDVRARIRVQATDDERRSHATHVVDNNGDLDALYRQVDALHDRLRAHATARATGAAASDEPSSTTRVAPPGTDRPVPGHGGDTARGEL